MMIVVADRTRDFLNIWKSIVLRMMVVVVSNVWNSFILIEIDGCGVMQKNYSSAI